MRSLCCVVLSPSHHTFSEPTAYQYSVLPCLGFARSRLSFNHGNICIESEGILITISKRRDRLKADIVKALLKCMLKRGLLFREDPSIMVEIGEDFGKELEG